MANFFQNPQSTSVMQISSQVVDDRLESTLAYLNDGTPGAADESSIAAKAYDVTTELGAKNKSWQVRVWSISPSNCDSISKNNSKNCSDTDIDTNTTEDTGFPKGLIALCSHGHGEHHGIISWAKFWPGLLSAGVHIIALEAPCFGRSSGSATGQANLWRYNDADLILRLLDVFGVLPTSHRVIIFGECMGAGISLRAFSKCPGYFSGSMVFHNTTIGTWPTQIEDVFIKNGGGILAYHETDSNHMREAVAYKKLLDLQRRYKKQFRLIDCPNVREEETSFDYFEQGGDFIQLSNNEQERGNQLYVLCPTPMALDACLNFALSPPKPSVADITAMARASHSLGQHSAVEQGTVSEGFRVVVRIRPLLLKDCEEKNAKSKGSFKNVIQVRDIEVKNRPSSATKTDMSTTTVCSEILLNQEDDSKLQSTEDHSNSTKQESKKSSRFVFDKVLEMNSTQLDVYRSSAKPLLDAILSTGEDGTIFAFGQTGSGKTHTIVGKLHQPSSSSQEMEMNASFGIIPRVMHDIYKWIRCVDSTNDHSTTSKRNVSMSFVELCDGTVTDLLSEQAQTVIPRRCTNQHGPSHDSGTIIIDSTNTTVVKPLDIIEFQTILEVAIGRRKSRETMMNHSSSRSHALLTLFIEGCEGVNGEQMSRLNIVDLAGSERVKRSVVSVKDGGLHEAAYINKDLLHLGRVVKALTTMATATATPSARSKKQHVHIPFRDSVLTQLLAPSLGGNCRALLIACVSPGFDSINETCGTLRFAATASHIQNKVFENERLAKEARALTASTTLVSSKKIELMSAASQLSTRAPELACGDKRGEFILPANWSSRRLNKKTSASQSATRTKVKTSGIHPKRTFSNIHVIGDFSAGSDSPLVVLLHYYGPGSEGGNCDFFSDWFDHLAASGIRVLAPSFPGHGKSEGPSLSSRPESEPLKEAGEIVVLRLLDYLGESKCYVCGYDWGGGVALELGVQYPSRICGILAWNASHRDSDNKLGNLAKSKMRKEKKLKVIWDPHPSYHPLKNGKRISKSLNVDLLTVKQSKTTTAVLESLIAMVS